MTRPNPAVWLEALAMAEAQALRGRRGANPLVGAVILEPGGGIVATGFHAGAGQPHAEVQALAALPTGWRARAAELTLLVTLEPCRLTGRTGPCVEAILDAGLGTVVFAAADPTGNAGGAELLRERGVRVHGPLDSASAQRLNPRWLRSREQGRPFVTAHLAQSLDARVADNTGASRWITGEASREHAHAVRSRVGAIVVGTGTVAADNPALTVRLPGAAPRSLPVVIAGTRALDPSLGLAQRAHAAAGVVQVREHEPRAALAAANADHVLVEGGPTLLSAFLDADLVDELYVYVAPILLGPGVGATAALRPRGVAAPLAWNHDPAGAEPARLGEDLLLHLTPGA